MAASSAVGKQASRGWPASGRSWLPRLTLPCVMLLAAANFLWQLGSSSYFVDEVQSIEVASNPFGQVLHAVGTIELTPPSYFYFLHEWLRWVHSLREWLTRLPSAICGVLLVAAVYWIALLLLRRRVLAALASATTALSPLILDLSQRAQPYIFVAFAVTVAVAAALAAKRRAQNRARWLLLAAAACIAALWTHYTAAFVAAALCVWVARAPAFTSRQRVTFIIAVAAASVSLVPVLIAQHHAIPVRKGVAAAAVVATRTTAQVLSTPLTGRVDALLPLAVLVTVAAVAGLLLRRPAWLNERWLLLGIAAGEPLFLLAASALGGHLMLTRYAAVAAPFLAVTIAGAIGALPRMLGVLLGGALAVVLVAALIASHQPSGFYFDARGTVAYLKRHVMRDDEVIAPSAPALALPLAFYGIARFHPYWLASGIPPRSSRRRWSLVPLQRPAASADRIVQALRYLLRSSGYQPVRARVLPGAVPLAVVLETPVRRQS